MSIVPPSIIHNFKNLKSNTVIIDTETTGLDYDAEIVEISIIDTKGNVLFDSLINPMRTIPDEAIAIHGITNMEASLAPSFAEVLTQIRQICHQKNVVFYNKKYDKRLIDQTCRLHGYQTTDVWHCEFLCAMESYADFKKTPNPKGQGYRWHSLSNAAKQLGIDVPDNLHRALPDALLTLEVIKAAHQVLIEKQQSTEQLEKTALKLPAKTLGETA
tara:strand:+ start:1581 stop:2228 length:648 start_codon:yes stop_codon:yes gene_type:complete